MDDQEQGAPAADIEDDADTSQGHTSRRRDNNRDRLHLVPLDTSIRLKLHRSQKPTVAGNGRRVAEFPEFGSGRYGWVTELRTGVYVYEAVAGVVQMLDQRKVIAALERMEGKLAKERREAEGEDQNTAPAEHGTTDAQLAAAVLKWRQGNEPPGQFSFDQPRAAEMLGLNLRTYVAMEEGKGFRYPRLIHLALLGFTR